MDQWRRGPLNSRSWTALGSVWQSSINRGGALDLVASLALILWPGISEWNLEATFEVSITCQLMIWGSWNAIYRILDRCWLFQWLPSAKIWLTRLDFRDNLGLVPTSRPKDHYTWLLASQTSLGTLYSIALLGRTLTLKASSGTCFVDNEDGR